MPIYDYQCMACGESFEFLAKTLSSAPEACPRCRGRELRKKVSVFSATVKGSAGCPSAGSCPQAHGPGCCCCH